MKNFFNGLQVFGILLIIYGIVGKFSNPENLKAEFIFVLILVGGFIWSSIGYFAIAIADDYNNNLMTRIEKLPFSFGFIVLLSFPIVLIYTKYSRGKRWRQ